MTHPDTPAQIAEDAAALVSEIGTVRAHRAVEGLPPSHLLTAAARRAERLRLRAAVEASKRPDTTAMTAAMESLDPAEFQRRVRVRRRRDALLGKASIAPARASEVDL